MTATAVDTFYYTESVTPVSTNLYRVLYDSQTSNLFVSFRSDPDKFYHYGSVPEDVFRDFVQAPSAGHYYATYIKGCYPRGVDGYLSLEKREVAPVAAPATTRPFVVTFNLSDSPVAFIQDAAELLENLVDIGFDFQVEGL